MSAEAGKGSKGSRVLDHFRNPRNTGIATNFNRRYLEQENRWLVRILLTLRVEADLVAEVKFKAQSCVTTVAALSALTELVEGKTVEQATAITVPELSEYLGGVPPEKLYCCQLAIDTLHHALKKPLEI